MALFVILCICLVSGQTGATTKPPCIDHLMEHNCPLIDDVCSNRLAKSICPRYCNLCDETKDHGHPTTTTATQVASKPPCPEHPDAELCHTQPNVCLDKLAAEFCPRHCNLCDPTKTGPQIITKPPCPHDLDEDKCYTIQNVCTDKIAAEFCPQHCGLCDPTKTAPHVETKPPCPEHLEEELCHTIPDVCENELAPVTCPLYCGLCDPSSTVAPKPSTVPPIKSTAASTTTTMTTRETTTTTTTTLCPDPVPDCCTTPDICTSNPLAARACPNTCGDIVTTSGAPSATQIVTTKVSTTQHISTTAIPPTTHQEPQTKPVASRMCHQCGDFDTDVPCDMLSLLTSQSKPCDKGSYCMTDLHNSQDGTQTDTYKRCVTREQCNRQWYSETSDQVPCVHYDETNLISGLTCHFCCTQDGCNSGTIPDKQTLFRP